MRSSCRRTRVGDCCGDSRLQLEDEVKNSDEPTGRESQRSSICYSRRVPASCWIVALLLTDIMIPTARAWSLQSCRRELARSGPASATTAFSVKTKQQQLHHRQYSAGPRTKAAPWTMSADSRELRFYSGVRTVLPDFSSSSASFSSCTTITRVATASLVGVAEAAPAAAVVDSVVHEIKHPRRRIERHTKMIHHNFFSTTTTADHNNHNNNSNNETAAQRLNPQQPQQPQQGFGPSISLTDEERHLFAMLRRAREETDLTTTLRVAGGWVRDKLLATPEFQTYHKVFDVLAGCGQQRRRLTAKFQKPSSMGRQGTKILVSCSDDDDCCSQPVDIDIALDDMLGREFADHLNEYLTAVGQETHSVGVVLKNPEKSKHLETATMKVASFWIDFVNLRAEEYTQDSRIPDLMRIGTAAEDAFRRDLTINALFYNINTGQVEDWTGRGFADLRKGIVATPLAPLTTLLDDPLRVLRSIRFAARLRFTMDQELIDAALDDRVRTALAQKVSRERVGGEVDLMLRSPDPVGAMRLLITLNLADTVFPFHKYLSAHQGTDTVLSRGLDLLSVAYDYLADCRLSPPLWCVNENSIYGGSELRLTQDDEARRLLWYASFLKPLWDESKLYRQTQKSQVSKRQGGRKSNRSIVSKILVDDLKRPGRDAEAVEKIIRAADDFTQLMDSGCDVSATVILLSEVRVTSCSPSNDFDIMEDPNDSHPQVLCSMAGRSVDSVTEDDPVWVHAMEFRQLCSNVMRRVGPLWRASLMLSISEQLAASEQEGLDYAIEGDIIEESQEERRHGIIERFDAFAAALQQLGLIGICNEKPLLDGQAVKEVLPRIPQGPAFRDVVDEQVNWMVSHPGAPVAALKDHLIQTFPDFSAPIEA